MQQMGRTNCGNERLDLAGVEQVGVMHLCIGQPHPLATRRAFFDSTACTS